MKISQLLESLNHQFKTQDTIKIDPDRADAGDIVDKLLGTLVRMAYTHLVADKVAHEKRYGSKSDEEDAYNFEFTEEELGERLSSLITSVTDKFNDLSTTELKDAISSVASEFQTPLEKK